MTGAGVVVLSGSNTYSGGSSVSAGTLLLSNAHGSATGTGALSVSAGATLGGYGTSSGTSFSIVGTGTATGGRANLLVGLNSLTDTNTTHSLTMTGSSTSTLTDVNLTFNLNAKSTASTQLNVGTTTVAFGSDIGSVQLTLNLQNEPAIVGAFTTYTLIAGTSSIDQYTGLTLGATTNLGNGATETIITGNNLQLAFGSSLDQSYYGAHSYLVLYQASGVDDIDVVVVPEPGTWALMIGGLGVLLFWQRRRKNS
jgi:autotransporter-associated beta strand protein